VYLVFLGGEHAFSGGGGPTGSFAWAMEKKATPLITLGGVITGEGTKLPSLQGIERPRGFDKDGFPGGKMEE